MFRFWYRFVGPNISGIVRGIGEAIYFRQRRFFTARLVAGGEIIRLKKTGGNRYCRAGWEKYITV